MIKNNSKIIVAVAMSGGVDSSVAAALLKKQSFQVFGVTMKTFCATDFFGTDNTDSKKICCGQDGTRSAKEVCQKLGIPHHTVDVTKEFTKEVINNFISEYQSGKTPNPCVRCNQFIKFDVLLKLVKKYGADFLATGHYARIVRFPKSNGFRESNNQYRLLRGKDSRKDQSYFLYNLNQKQLAQIIFPVGDFKKEEVRSLARKFKLSVAEKPESQEICFVDTNISDFLRSRIKSKEGNIVDASGKILGKHRGRAFYTIGQRAGIGGKGPYYIAKIDKKNNRLIVTNNPHDPVILKKETIVSNVKWVAGVLPKNKNIQAQIRYRAKATKGRVAKLAGNKVKIQFVEPVFAPAPGQSAVFYRNEECLGGGIIA